MNNKDLVEIFPNDTLLRRIPRQPAFINEQNTITSACFKTKKGEDGLSVDIQKLIEGDITNRYNNDTHILALIKAKIPMDLGYECQHKPVEGNYSHGIIIGDTSSIAKQLASNCKISDPKIYARK